MDRRLASMLGWWYWSTMLTAWEKPRDGLQVSGKR